MHPIQDRSSNARFEVDDLLLDADTIDTPGTQRKKTLLTALDQPQAKHGVLFGFGNSAAVPRIYFVSSWSSGPVSEVFEKLSGTTTV